MKFFGTVLISFDLIFLHENLYLVFGLDILLSEKFLCEIFVVALRFVVYRF